MGIAEEYAHKLATDRNMTDIKAMTADEIASCLGVSKDDEIFTGAMNALAELGNRRQKRRSRKITISKKALDDDDMDFAGTKFNVLNHVLVPHHSPHKMFSLVDLLIVRKKSKRRYTSQLFHM